MKFSLSKMIGRFAALILVTIFAVAAMLATNTRWFVSSQGDDEANPPVENSIQLSAVPVSVRRLEKEPVEITDIYSGMIYPFERYTYSFEIAGRIESLGKNQSGSDLDEGDQVQAGDILAVLDRRALLAHIQESNARKEQAEEEYNRAVELRKRNTGAISDTELRLRLTDMQVAKAQSSLAQKNLDDATLTSTVAGVISRRLANSGESVKPQQAVFEIVQVEKVLLVVGVPESRITALVTRQRELARRKSENGRSAKLRQPAPYIQQELLFTVHVELVGRGALHQKTIVQDGEVYRIGQTADDKTGLFQVEILLPNDDLLLRPGLVAIASIVVDRVEAFRVPSSSALFIDGHTYLFSVKPTISDVELLFWKVGSSADYHAARWELRRENYLEQDSDLIIYDLPVNLRTVIVRGQRRLVNNRPVNVVSNGDDSKPDQPDSTAPKNVRTAEVGP